MKETIISITQSDCEFKTSRGSGAGGQHRNKTETAVHCIHKKSNAVGYSCDGKSQRANKETAFSRMVATKEFKTWLKLEISRRTGEQKSIEETVDRLMDEKYIKAEVKNERGLWVDEKDHQKN